MKLIKTFFLFSLSKSSLLFSSSVLSLNLLIASLCSVSTSDSCCCLCSSSVLCWVLELFFTRLAAFLKKSLIIWDAVKFIYLFGRKEKWSYKVSILRINLHIDAVFMQLCRFILQIMLSIFSKAAVMYNHNRDFLVSEGVYMKFQFCAIFNRLFLLQSRQGVLPHHFLLTKPYKISYWNPPHPFAWKTVKKADKKTQCKKSQMSTETIV